MKYISNFNDYQINEEIKLKDAIVGGALAASTILGSGCEPLPQVRVDDVETINKYQNKFDCLDIATKDREYISIVASEDKVVSCKWKTVSGKTRKTHYTLSVPEGTKIVFHGRTGFFGQALYTKKEISDSFYDLEKDFKFIKDVPGGKIFKADSFLDNTYLFVYDKDYNHKDNLFTANGRSYNVFLEEDFFRDIYFVIPVSR